MLASSLAAGLRVMRARPGLAALLFVINLAVALVLAVPIAVALGLSVPVTGFDADLAAGFDVVLFADIMQRNGDFFATLTSQLFWMLPLLLAWNTAIGVGLVHALWDGGARSFWDGVGRYFGRGFLLTLLFLVPVVIWVIASMVVGLVVTSVWDGEIGFFRGWFVIMPTLLITGLAITDLMQDYARAALVIGRRPVFSALLEGLAFPLRNGTASWLYLIWFVPAALLWILPGVLEALVGAGFLLFLVQQVFLFGRAAATVGWIGSEVALYEEVARRRSPLIVEPSTSPADEAPETPVGFA